MEIVEVEIKYLKPSEYNPREITEKSFEALKNSIKEFGLVEPIVVNADNQIIGGHMRVEAAKELNHTVVPVIYVDLPKSKEKLLNLALNRIQGRWDYEKLSSLMSELEGIEDLDLELTGFEIVELEGKQEFKPLTEIETFSGRRLIAIQSVVPSGFNPNQMTEKEFDGLKRSLQSVGMLSPIVVRPIGKGKYSIIDGEHRWQAAKHLGWKEVPIVVIEMSELEAKRAVIAANRIKGRFNSDRMAPLVKELSDEDRLGLQMAAAMDAQRVREYTGLEGNPLLEGEAGRRQMREYERGKDYDAPGGQMTLIIVLSPEKYNTVVKRLNEISVDWAEAIVKLVQ